MRASEMRTMSVTPFSQQLRRQAHVADLGHARIALGPAVLEDQDASLASTSRSVVVDRRL